jgi:hypothetical protein
MNPIENPHNHDPHLSKDHDAGPPLDRLSPAERALAPEADAPYQSADAVADDGTYVGQAGGYFGGESPAAETGEARVQPGSERGESTYGYPAGPGTGDPGGEHRWGANRRQPQGEDGPPPRQA